MHATAPATATPRLLPLPLAFPVPLPPRQFPDSGAGVTRRPAERS